MQVVKIAAAFLFFSGLLTLNGPAYSAPACKGPNKYDAGCPDAATEPAPEEPAPEEPVTAAAAVDNATVDWLNQKIVLRGSGFTGTTQFVLGGSSPLVPTSVSDTVAELDFSTALADEVDRAGNYVLKADGAGVLSLYFKSEVIDPGATDCPCDSQWADQLSAVALWGPPNSTQCLEIGGPETNDLADIAGTIISDPENPSAPQYPIGAAFVPGDPVSSVCRLVLIDSDGSQSDLVNLRINEGQQTACATTLQTHVCADPTP